MTIFFIPICKDLYSTVFSFLLYTESINLQKCSKYSLKQKEKMNKYCQHIQPYGKIETYDKITKLIIKEANYKEGKKDGIYKGWYLYSSVYNINGQLCYENNYKKDKPEGIQRGWYENGSLMYEHNYYNGKQEGIQKWWLENEYVIPQTNGQLYSEENYKEGILIKKYL